MANWIHSQDSSGVPVETLCVNTQKFHVLSIGDMFLWESSLVFFTIAPITNGSHATTETTKGFFMCSKSFWNMWWFVFLVLATMYLAREKWQLPEGTILSFLGHPLVWTASATTHRCFVYSMQIKTLPPIWCVLPPHIGGTCYVLAFLHYASWGPFCRCGCLHGEAPWRGWRAGRGVERLLLRTTSASNRRVRLRPPSHPRGGIRTTRRAPYPQECQRQQVRVQHRKLCAGRWCPCACDTEVC